MNICLVTMKLRNKNKISNTKYTSWATDKNKTKQKKPTHTWRPLCLVQKKKLPRRNFVHMGVWLFQKCFKLFFCEFLQLAHLGHDPAPIPVNEKTLTDLNGARSSCWATTSLFPELVALFLTWLFSRPNLDVWTKNPECPFLGREKVMDYKTQI